MTSTSPRSSNSDLPSSSDQPSTNDRGSVHRPWVRSTEPSLAASVPTGLFRCEVRSTAVQDGDFGVAQPQPDIEQRRQRIVAHPWTWLRQTHSTTVVKVERAGQHAGVEADGAVTGEPFAPIAVTTADCSPVVLVGTTAIAVVHAGWRGASEGIIEQAIDHMQVFGADPVATLLGPCIGPLDYAFGADDLSAIEERYGPNIRSATRRGELALDMAALISSAVTRAGWPEPATAGCTSDSGFYSHRTRLDRGRQTTVAWLEPATTELASDTGHQ